MDGCTKAWLTFGLVAVVLVFGVPAGCLMHENQQISRMVVGGVSPAEAKCAIKMDYGQACWAAAVLKQIEK